ncbi:MAG: helix-turn-helix transcriptional regulator [Pseudomonadota bacterium]
MLAQANLTDTAILTAREHQILELVAHGLSTKEVARHVQIAPRTVDRHVDNVRFKLRARNRIHMVTCAMIGDLL